MNEMILLVRDNKAVCPSCSGLMVARQNRYICIDCRQAYIGVVAGRIDGEVIAGRPVNIERNIRGHSSVKSMDST